MTPCRPEKPQPWCDCCTRKSLPITHRGANYKTVELVRMDPTSVLKPGKRCPFYTPTQEAR